MMVLDISKATNKRTKKAPFKLLEYFMSKT